MSAPKVALSAVFTLAENCKADLRLSDLLIRHERLVHLPANGTDKSRRAKPQSAGDASSITSGATSVIQSPPRRLPLPPSMIDQLPHHRSSSTSAIPRETPITVDPIQTLNQQAAPTSPSWGYDLKLLSHAANHVARGQPAPVQPSLKPSTHTSPTDAQQLIPPTSSPFEATPSMLGFADVGDPMADFTVFLES
ncbi:hypothetical protein KEM54_002594, partial [Ascosphaera aggregata]